MTLQKLALICGAAAAFALPAAAVQAQNVRPDENGRCLAVSLAMASSQDATTRNVGTQGIIYYLGKVDGGPLRGDLETRLAAQFATLNTQSAQQDAQACVKAMGARSAAFQTVAEHLLKRFGKPAPASAPAPAGH